MTGAVNRTVTGMPTPTTSPRDGVTPATATPGVVAAMPVPAGAVANRTIVASTTIPHRSTLGMQDPFDGVATIRTVIAEELQTR
jgi:hypothetical protein